MSEMRNDRMNVSDLSNQMANSKVVGGIRSTVGVAIHTVVPYKTRITC